MAVGQSIPMVDARARVTGEIEYALNLELPGMLHAAILRSPHAHARVLRVDTSKAERLSGVIAVLSRDDLLNQDEIFPYYGQVYRDQAAVALDKVRHVGDPVAAVAAVDLETAEAALALIEVDYEELPAVLDIDAALAPGAPLVHEGPRRVHPNRPDVAARKLDGTNLTNIFRQRQGDIEQGFAESDLIFENTYTCPAVQHVPLEPHITIAQVRDGRITIWSATQTPYMVQGEIAEMCRVPISDVRLIVFTLGGGYGAKSNPKLEPLAVLLARKARRPVKIALRREEDFLMVTKHAAKVRLKTGVKRDGTLVALQATCYYQGGAYADTSPNLPSRGYVATGPYRVPHVWVDSYGVYTNNVPAGAFRGYGISQVAWAHESQMDVIAEGLGIDPLELRLKNVVRAGDHLGTGEAVKEMYYPELLQEATRWIGWNDGPTRVREGSKIRAKGLSSIIKGGQTPTTSESIVKLNVDGSLNVLTSSVEMGQGSTTVLAQIAAHEATLPFERVHISQPDTSVTPFDSQTSASRTTACMGTAIRRAVKDVKRQLLALASEQLEIGQEDLDIADGRVRVRGSPERSLTFTAIMRRVGRGSIVGNGTLVTKGSLDPETGRGIGSWQWHPAVAACEIEVDTETGKIEVTRLHGGLYVGTAINPRHCKIQIEGSLLFGLGQALFEEVVADSDGHITNANLGDYMIPSFEDVPRQLSVQVLEDRTDEDVHGIGETGLPPVMPAVANAMSRALGVRVTDLPLTPEKVLAALEAAERAEPRDRYVAAHG